MKDYESDEAAKKQCDKSCLQKIPAGYHRIFTSEEPKADNGSVSARDQELEKAILASPDEPSAYVANGNWLRVQGDPRGELIELQASGTARKAWAKLSSSSMPGASASRSPTSSRGSASMSSVASSRTGAA